VHKHLEDRVRDGTPLPTHLARLEPKLAAILATPHDTLEVEHRYAFAADFSPVDWDSSDAWVRGIVDLELHHRGQALLVDYKTGTRRPGSEQLKLNAAFVMQAKPEIQEVTTGFWWLKDKKLDREKFSRSELAGVWAGFLPRVRRLEAAHQNSVWRAVPSGLCRNFCKVTRSQCEFSQRRT
jgi:hypothetical protein